MKRKQKTCLLIIAALIMSGSCKESSKVTPVEPLETGDHSFISRNVERTFYLKLPEDYSCEDNYPIIFGFHGTSGSHLSYLNNYYNLHDSVGEEAILVYPNALNNASGISQWDFVDDLLFFDDIYAYIVPRVCFDKNRVFAVGHSSGAGLAHTLGQKKNIFRAIAPVAGVLVQMTSCNGRTAVIQIQGKYDEMVPPSEGENTRDYWLTINSCDDTTTLVGIDPFCAAYQECSDNYPVQYCEHDLSDDTHPYPGHAWPDFAGDAIWNFFKSLPVTEPSPDMVPFSHSLAGSLDFKINYPADFVGTAEVVAVTLYPHTLDYTQPILVMPSHFLNTDISPGNYSPGDTMVYEDIEINLNGVNFGDYLLSIVVYVEGGNFPIPTSGQDYVGFQAISINEESNYVLETPFEIDFLDSFKK